MWNLVLRLVEDFKFTDHLKGQMKIEVFSRKDVDICANRRFCHVHKSFSALVNHPLAPASALMEQATLNIQKKKVKKC